MNNLDKIIDKIILDASLQAEEIIAEANASAEKITEDGEVAVADILKRAKLDARRESELYMARAESSGDMKSREILLSARVAMINKAFSNAEMQILEAPDEEYCAFLSHLLADSALDRINTCATLSREYGEEVDSDAAFEVIFNEKDCEKHSKNVLKGAKALLRKISAPLGKTAFLISEETRDISGGLILRHGDIEINCSVETVIGDARRACEAQVIKALFTEASNQ